MRWPWQARRPTEEEAEQARQAREAAVAAEREDDPQKALDRARTARSRAAGHLEAVRKINGEIKEERLANHLASDVYEAMRRRR